MPTDRVLYNKIADLCKRTELESEGVLPREEVLFDIRTSLLALSASYYVKSLKKRDKTSTDLLLKHFLSGAKLYFEAFNDYDVEL